MLNWMYLGVILSSIISLIMLIGNMYWWVSKKYSSSRDTEKVKEKIIFYKKNSLLSSGYLILTLIFIMLYTKPLSFFEIVDINDNKSVDSISIYGNISGPQIKYLNSNDSSKIIYLLSDYKYKRTFAFNNIGGEVEFLVVNNHFIEIRESGYLRMVDDRVYKIDEKNNHKLYNALKNEINNMEISE